jgi:hypothetical protein
MNRFQRGRVFQIIGVILLLVGLVCFVITFPGNWKLGDDFYFLALVFHVLSGGLLGCAVTVYNKGRRLRLQFGDEVLAKGQPYVLYLRSFDSQTVTNRIPLDELNVIVPPIKFSSEEEKLAKALRVIGPGITVAKPGEEWPSLGFSRLKIVNNDWLSTVEGLISDARLVVVRIDKTSGVLSELKVARKLLNPERLVLLVPKESDLIRDFSERDTGIQLLPYGPHGARWEVELSPGLTSPILKVPFRDKVRYSCAGIIYFDSDWVGHSRLLSDMTINFTHALDRAFKPVYKQLGVKKGIRLYQVMAVLVGIYMVAFLALYKYYVR